MRPEVKDTVRQVEKAAQKSAEHQEEAAAAKTNKKIDNYFKEMEK